MCSHIYQIASARIGGMRTSGRAGQYVRFGFPGWTLQERLRLENSSQRRGHDAQLGVQIVTLSRRFEGAERTTTQTWFGRN